MLTAYFSDEFCSKMASVTEQSHQDFINFNLLSYDVVAAGKMEMICSEDSTMLMPPAIDFAGLTLVCKLYIFFELIFIMLFINHLQNF